MKRQYEDQFEIIFQSESLRGERIHWQVNWLLYSVVFLLSAFVYFIQGNEAGKSGMILGIFNLLYNSFITYYFYTKKSVFWLSYVTMFINIGSLTVYTFLDANYNSPLLPSTSAALLVYPILMFMAALRMDKYLIIWTTFLSLLSMDGLYIYYHNSIDPSLFAKKMSVDPLSQGYRSVYLIIIAFLIYSVPKSIRRVLRTQEDLARENYENKRKAQLDSLTGIYNRDYFEQHLSTSIQSAMNLQHKFALLFIDLNGFKTLNDTFGHDTGDFILKSIASDITHTIREQDMVARIGGDEFIIIMSQLATYHEADGFSHRILSTITRKRSYDGHEINVGASIGIALFPDDAEDMAHLIKYADEAMYRVKRNKIDGISFYNPDCNTYE